MHHLLRSLTSAWLWIVPVILLLLSQISQSVFAQRISTIAGNGIWGYNGDGGLATSGQLRTPKGVAVDGNGNVYIAEWLNYRVRRVSIGGIINTVAGNGAGGYNGDGIPATDAWIFEPTGVAIDSIGNIFIADKNNHRIRKVTPGGIISTVAGIGTGGYSGDKGRATEAQLLYPSGIAVDGSGNFYVADTDNHRIRKVTPGAIISTIAGIGSFGYSGDGGIANEAQLANPSGVAVDKNGNLYIADYFNRCIRKVTPGGIISTVAGNGTWGYSGDGGRATEAQIKNPNGVAVDNIGNLYIADTFNQRIRKVTSGGIITTVAGNGTAGFDGDGELATNAKIYDPAGVTVDGSGNIYIADLGNHRVRKVTLPPITSVKVGNWNDPNVWSYSRVAVSTDVVQINHAISLPASYESQALRVIYGVDGRLLFNTSSGLRLTLH